MHEQKTTEPNSTHPDKYEDSSETSNVNDDNLKEKKLLQKPHQIQLNRYQTNIASLRRNKATTRQTSFINLMLILNANSNGRGDCDDR